MIKFRGVLHAKPGCLFAGVTRKAVSSWFDTRQDAEDWLYAMQGGLNADIVASTEVQEKRTK